MVLPQGTSDVVDTSCKCETSQNIKRLAKRVVHLLRSKQVGNYPEGCIYLTSLLAIFF